jgi:hypothetical protein
MNEIARTVVPASPQAVSPELLRLVEDAAENGINLAARGVMVTDVIRAEATRLLGVLDARRRPAEQEDIAFWLYELNFRMARPIGGADFELRAPAIAESMRALPGCVFNSNVLRAASLTFKYFPGAKELADFLRPWVRRLCPSCHLLDAIAKARPPVLPAQPMSAEERNRVAAKRDAVVKAIYEKHGFSASGPPRTVEEQLNTLAHPRPRPAYLSPEQLAAARAKL